MRMTTRRRELFEGAMAEANAARAAGRLDEAFAHLERAHVIGQFWIGPHLASHWGMLLVGLDRRDPREILGQAVRLVLTIPGSLLGRLPHGNTGGANVSAFRPMPIDAELQRALAEADAVPELR